MYPQIKCSSMVSKVSKGYDIRRCLVLLRICGVDQALDEGQRISTKSDTTYRSYILTHVFFICYGSTVGHAPVV